MMRCIKAGVLLLGVHWLAAPAPACIFCEQTGPTLLQTYKQARVILFGKFTKARLAGADGRASGSSDFVIQKVFKAPAGFGDRKVITIARYVPPSKSMYLLFCNLAGGKIDPFRPVEIFKGGVIVKYLTGLRALQEKSVTARLRYCFDYLDDPEMEIAMDAYREYAVAKYEDYRFMARKLPPDRIAGWLEDRRTPSNRYGLYASLLGHCGKDKHARLLRRLLDDPRKRNGSGVNGMLAGYTLLGPKRGWSYIRAEALGRPEESFQFRYAALQTVRFFWEIRRDVIKKKDLLAGFCRLLPQADLADIAIEELRKWHCWEVSGQVVALAAKDTHNFRTMRRAILRYALSCPAKYTKAAEFVKRERRRNREEVAEIEELLKLD